MNLLKAVSMVSAASITLWTSVGALAGATLAAYTRRLHKPNVSGLVAPRRTAPLLTALAFGVLAWRFGYQFDLLPYSVLAVIGVALGLIDLIEQRLPSVLIFSGVVLVGALLATSAILHSKGSDLLRALAGMAMLATFYLVLALVSRGGLGAGDVKLGGLLGLALGWLSWSALVTGTLLGWFAAGLTWLILRMIRRKLWGSVVPMGPFLVLGTLVTIILMSA
jgi:leader peptidase (prepilin peptidase)/N-methyltransferase